MILKLCRQLQNDLESQFGGHNTAILQSTLNPCDPFIADDYFSPYDHYNTPLQKELPDPAQHAAEEQAKEEARMRRRRARRPQVAFRRLIGRNTMEDDAPSLTATSVDASGDTDKSQNDGIFKEDIYMTTPLHEAARLGTGDFVRFLLAQGGADPNTRNGLARTALHACAGGLTVEEETLVRSTIQDRIGGKSSSKLATEERAVGIRATFLPEEIFRLMHLNHSCKDGADKIKGENGDASRGLIGRIFGSTRGSRRSIEIEEPETAAKSSVFDLQPDPERLGAISTERMDAMLAILSWVQTETGDGPSINAVDSDGRTALHYAAELGRSDLCMAILSNFGAMLTIVDDLGARTPCEVASSQGHKALAAQLEARALLYIDPYGLDDDLMDNMNATSDGSDPRSQLVPPFKWFKTLSVEEVREEILERVSKTRSEMLRAAEEYDIKAAVEVNGGKSNSSVDGSEASRTASEADDIEEDESLDAKPALQESTVASTSAANAKLSESSPCLVPVPSTADIFNNLQDSHVERFLSFHKWQVTEAMKEFREDPTEAFTRAAIPLPTKIEFAGKTEERMCPICYDDVDKNDWMQLGGCKHGFCKTCLSEYIQERATDMTPIFAIACPHHECAAIFAKHNIETLFMNEKPTLERLHEAAVANFVTVSNDFRYCPFPACEGIVHRLPHKKFSGSGFDPQLLNYSGATCTAIKGKTKIGDDCTLTYEGVEDLDYLSNSFQPPKAHRFCFACGESTHWPVSCERLEKWKDKIMEEIGDANSDGEEHDYNDLAQKMWIKANTQPCPSCNVNIEKNDGCNHMICSNPQCLYEFCWICRKDWKLHGTSTGGFFRCNIWQEEEHIESSDAPGEEDGGNTGDSSNDEGYGTAIHAAREAWKKKQEVNRFIHHYTRWEAHEQSSSLESKMRDGACARLAPVVEAAADFDGSDAFNFGGHGLSFVHSAFTELLECRSVLRHSYAFSYFRYPTFSASAYQTSHLYGKRKEKLNFERLQSELEVLTEQMSDIVARSHLRATQIQITFLTKAAAEKRVEFTNMMFQIYKDEKKELARYEQRKEEEERNGTKAPDANMPGTGRARNSLAQIMAMHQSGRDRHFVNDDLNDALADFMERTRVFEPDRARRGLDDGPVRMWECSRCTYMNNGGRHCEMCGSRR
ncbi:MAG: hypothetical protein SGILL_005595 [Bacillariaceae sp.]